MSRFNDIEQEFQRFEAEIQQMPAPAQPRQQNASGFIPPQLRRQPVGVRPLPPPPPPPPQMAPSFPAPVQLQANFMPASKYIPVRPNVIIEAKPIRYGESDDTDGVPINSSPSIVSSAKPTSTSSSSDALARAKSVLESLSVPSSSGSSSTPNMDSATISLAKHPGPGAVGNGGGSSIPMPLNMPGSITSSASAPAKKAAKILSSSASEEPEFNGIRKAGGKIWTDMTLFEWDASDHRMFCGDLGNETTDESLTKVFSTYPSFQRAKVIRDKRTNKTRGFGFVSFKNAQDLARAIREMNGKYVGNRPIKLRKSNWEDRNLELVKKKDKNRKRLGMY